MFISNIYFVTDRAAKRTKDGATRKKIAGPGGPLQGSYLFSKFPFCVVYFIDKDALHNFT